MDGVGIDSIKIFSMGRGGERCLHNPVSYRYTVIALGLHSYTLQETQTDVYTTQYMKLGNRQLRLCMARLVAIT